MADNKGILLESGTNELEIVVFTIGDNYFGINVAKVKEIMSQSKITTVPNSHPAIKGIFKPRDIVMTVVNLPKYLNFNGTVDESKEMLIITHFNKLNAAFLVHSVVGINRISWEAIEKPDSTLYGGNEGLCTGIVKQDGKLIMILDFEKILADISPQTGIQMSDIDKLGHRERNGKHILIAEDSELLAKMITDALAKAGYTNLTHKTNGKELWELLESYKKDASKSLADKVACIITDIEMPQMDGHHLTKLIKEDEDLKAVPVIIFSSLINEDMKRKGEALGADAQISKPEIINLVGLIDRFTK